MKHDEQFRTQPEGLLSTEKHDARAPSTPADGPDLLDLPSDPAELLAELLRQRHELQVHQIELELQNEQLSRTNSALEEARHEFQELFDGAPVGYVVLDRSGAVLRANLTVARQLAADRTMIQRRRFSSFVDRSDASSYALFLRRVLEGQRPQVLELPLNRSGGGSFVARLEGEAVPGTQGEGAVCRVTVTDITLQREAQDEVQRLNETLEERVNERTEQLRGLNEELETFMHAVTHDLLAPLRHIRAFTRLLLGDLQPQTPQQQGHAEKVEQSVTSMETLLDALMDFFRSGQQRLRFQPVDLNRVLTEVRKDLAAEFEGREVRLEADPLPVVRGDSLALQLVFSSLLGNALKFTRQRPSTRIRVCSRETAREYVVCVEDNGVGFNMRQKTRLFGMFQRLHSGEQYEGLGVGLALVRRLVQRHGGRVWAEGTPDQGATFWISFPKAAQDSR